MFCCLCTVKQQSPGGLIIFKMYSSTYPCQAVLDGQSVAVCALVDPWFSLNHRYLQAWRVRPGAVPVHIIELKILPSTLIGAPLLLSDSGRIKGYFKLNEK